MRPLLFVDGSSRLTARIVLAVSCLFASAPALAQGELKPAPLRLTLPVTGDPPGELCRRLETSGAPAAGSVSLHRTFHDDFDEHPLLNGKWAPHYAGGAAWLEARYWGGEGSDFKRKTAYNGEQQIYVDPRYAGQAATPLGLDPFKVRDGILSIVASRTPPALKQVLFDNAYVSGILTTQSSFSQKHGYFEIRAKIPVGSAVWPAFWLLANDGGWPPEIDVVEGRGEEPGDLVMTTHWRVPATGKVASCGFDFSVPDASSEFHDYGVLWRADRLVYFIDRKPVSDIKVPIGFDDPMYMIVNLAMGSKYFGGVGAVDAESPATVASGISIRYISENGRSSADTVAADGNVYDIDRVMYLRNYLVQLQRATSEGIPVRGYFLWSLIDNFEWIFGFEQRFGLYRVDFETLARTPKLSVQFFRDVVARNAIGT